MSLLPWWHHPDLCFTLNIISLRSKSSISVLFPLLELFCDFCPELVTVLEWNWVFTGISFQQQLSSRRLSRSKISFTDALVGDAWPGSSPLPFDLLCPACHWPWRTNFWLIRARTLCCLLPAGQLSDRSRHHLSVATSWVQSRKTPTWLVWVWDSFVLSWRWIVDASQFL